ncbi:hypothetical protein BH160DRAFT_0070 [Burkholderia sp. H160]|nr:hypothetical protein BH160DRAFT_0070 [Burkholderia sp. H160]
MDGQRQPGSDSRVHTSSGIGFRRLGCGQRFAQQTGFYAFSGRCYTSRHHARRHCAFLSPRQLRPLRLLALPSTTTARTGDREATDLVHGHSSHYVKGIEVYREKLILCGAGVSSTITKASAVATNIAATSRSRNFRSWSLPTAGSFRRTMTPTRIRGFCVNLAPDEGVRWLASTLCRESRRWGCAVKRQPDNALVLQWRASPVRERG